jgi:hypothetical protein
VGSLSPQRGASSGCGWRNGLQIWRLAENILVSSRGQKTRGGPPALGLGVGLTTPHRKKYPVTNNLHKPRTWSDSLDKQPTLRNMDMRFGLWNIRSLYRAGSLMTVTRELTRYKLDLVGV